MANPKVTFLVPDISSNILWAATALAGSLKGSFDTEIIGPDLGEGVCSMYRDTYPYTVVPARQIYRFPDFLWQRRRIARAITGDLIVAVKAYADTLPVALAARTGGRKVVVYLDEWDAANYYQLAPRERALRWIQHAHHPLDDVYFPLVERQIRRADHVICTSSFLRDRFGGTVIPLGVDTDMYHPQDPGAPEELKRKLGMAGDRLIVFGGVVRPHKGVEELVEALARIGDAGNHLLVVGPQSEFLRSLQRSDRYAPYIVCIGPKPKADMPKYLALGDLVVLPQKDTLLARSQVPCKVFEAMAMAKPIIATSVSDLPQILDGCGWIVPPNNVDALAAAIDHAFSHPEEGAALGLKAREKCVAEYDRHVTSRALVSLMHRLIGEEPSTINH